MPINKENEDPYYCTECHCFHRKERWDNSEQQFIPTKIFIKHRNKEIEYIPSKAYPDPWIDDGDIIFEGGDY